MGYNARNDEIHENLERMRREREAHEDALAIVRQLRPASPNGTFHRLRGAPFEPPTLDR